MIDQLTEGDYDPGYDAPVIYQVRFLWRGRQHTVKVEAPNSRREAWAISRGIASVLRREKVPDEQMSLEIHKVMRHGRVRVTDVSDTAEPKAVPFRSRRSRSIL